MRPFSSRSGSRGPKRPTIPNSSVKASQCSSHALRPKTNMPASVMAEYTTAAVATTDGRLAMPLVSSRQANVKYSKAAGQTPTWGSVRTARSGTKRSTASWIAAHGLISCQMLPSSPDRITVAAQK